MKRTASWLVLVALLLALSLPAGAGVPYYGMAINGNQTNLYTSVIVSNGQLYAVGPQYLGTNILSIQVSSLSGGGGAGQHLMLGTDPASGTDSSELHRIYGTILASQTNTWLRQQFIRWYDIETAPGVYNFTNTSTTTDYYYGTVTHHSFDLALAANTVSNFDATVAPLPINQPKIMFNVFQAPYWVVYTNSPSQAAYIASETNFVKAVLNHAPGRYFAVEYVNEPFTNQYPGMTTSYTNTAQFVAQLGAAVRKAVRDVDPTVLVVGPSLSSPYDNNFMAAFSAAGGFTNLDAVSFHDYRMTGTFSNAPTYTPTDNPPGLTNLAACVANLNGWSSNKPVYVTELGLGVVSNVVAYVTLAGQLGIAGTAATYFLGSQVPGQLYLTGYWNYAIDGPAPNGSAYISTMKLVNTPSGVPAPTLYFAGNGLTLAGSTFSVNTNVALIPPASGGNILYNSGTLVAGSPDLMYTNGVIALGGDTTVFLLRHMTNGNYHGQNTPAKIVAGSDVPLSVESALNESFFAQGFTNRAGNGAEQEFTYFGKRGHGTNAFYGSDVNGVIRTEGFYLGWDGVTIYIDTNGVLQYDANFLNVAAGINWNYPDNVSGTNVIAGFFVGDVNGFHAVTYGFPFDWNGHPFITNFPTIIVNVTTNRNQSVLNLQAGSNIILTPSGNSPTTTVTIASSGGGGGLTTNQFNQLSASNNATATGGDGNVHLGTNSTGAIVGSVSNNSTLANIVATPVTNAASLIANASGVIQTEIEGTNAAIRIGALSVTNGLARTNSLVLSTILLNGNSTGTGIVVSAKDATSSFAYEFLDGGGVNSNKIRQVGSKLTVQNGLGVTNNILVATDTNGMQTITAFTNGWAEYVFTNMGVNVDCTAALNAFIIAHQNAIIRGQAGTTNYVLGASNGDSGGIPCSVLITNSNIYLKDLFLYSPHVPVSGVFTSQAVLTISDITTNTVVDNVDLVGPGNGTNSIYGPNTNIPFNALQIMGITNDHILVKNSRLHDVMHGVLFGGGPTCNNGFFGLVRYLTVQDSEIYNTGGFVPAEGINDGHSFAGGGYHIYYLRNNSHDGIANCIENYQAQATVTNTDWRIEGNEINNFAKIVYTAAGVVGGVFRDTRFVGNHIGNALTNALNAQVDFTGSIEENLVCEQNVVNNYVNITNSASPGNVGIIVGIAVDLGKIHGGSVSRNTVIGTSGSGFQLKGQNTNQGAATLLFNGNQSYSNAVCGLDLDGADGGLTGLVVTSFSAFNNVGDGVRTRGSVVDVTINGGIFDNNGGYGLNLSAVSSASYFGYHAQGNASGPLNVPVSIAGYAQDSVGNVTQGGSLSVGAGETIGGNLTVGTNVSAGGSLSVGTSLTVTNNGAGSALQVGAFLGGGLNIGGALVITSSFSIVTSPPPAIAYDPTFCSCMMTSEVWQFSADASISAALVGQMYWLSMTNAVSGGGMTFLGFTNSNSKSGTQWPMNGSPPILRNRDDTVQVLWLSHTAKGTLAKGTNFAQWFSGNIVSNLTVQGVSIIAGSLIITNYAETTGLTFTNGATRSTIMANGTVTSAAAGLSYMALINISATITDACDLPVTGAIQSLNRNFLVPAGPNDICIISNFAGTGASSTLGWTKGIK